MNWAHNTCAQQSTGSLSAAGAKGSDGFDVKFIYGTCRLCCCFISSQNTSISQVTMPFYTENWESLFQNYGGWEAKQFYKLLYLNYSNCSWGTIY